MIYLKEEGYLESACIFLKSVLWMVIIFFHCVNAKVIKSLTWPILTKPQLSMDWSSRPSYLYTSFRPKSSLDISSRPKKTLTPNQRNIGSAFWTWSHQQTFTKWIGAKEGEHEKIHTPSEPALSGYRLFCALCID